MGIKGIYQQIGEGRRVALSKLAVEHYEKNGRPLRLAIDISIWLFQIQSGKGGTNPALRTFFYRLLRLISLSIHPLFVFDGPNKPPFKRNKRTGPNVASVPEFLAKQLLEQFGLPFHLAPGEAEAECAFLQRKGVVDAVLSEDVDTLMFGSGLTFRNWTPDADAKTKSPTHVNVYEAGQTKAQAGLDRPGMILVAMMSGGDYIPEGIPGIGSKTACEAARARFGEDLCKIRKGDKKAIGEWKELLHHELRTNESKFFKQKHKTLQIPEDFPRTDVLAYYTDPVVSSDQRLEQIKQSIQWDRQFDIPGLRKFCLDAFDWRYMTGAKHFIRNLSPALLVRALRMQADETALDDEHEIAVREAKLVKTIHSRRQHRSTDNTDELRVGFCPIELVPLVLEAEEPDPELSSDVVVPGADEDEAELEEMGEEPQSPRKKRKPAEYDPHSIMRVWIFETFVKVGVPMKAQDWQETFLNAKKYEAMKALRKRTEKGTKASKSRSGMQQGALDPFARVTKPGVSKPKSKSHSPEPPLPSQASMPADEVQYSRDTDPSGCAKPNNIRIAAGSGFQTPLMPSSSPPRTEHATMATAEVSLLSSPPSKDARNSKKRPLIRSTTGSPCTKDQQGQVHMTRDSKTSSPQPRKLPYRSTQTLPTITSIDGVDDEDIQDGFDVQTVAPKLLDQEWGLLSSARPVFKVPPEIPRTPTKASRESSNPGSRPSRTRITLTPTSGASRGQRLITHFLASSSPPTPSPVRNQSLRVQDDCVHPGTLPVSEQHSEGRVIETEIGISAAEDPMRHVTYRKSPRRSPRRNPRIAKQYSAQALLKSDANAHHRQPSSTARREIAKAIRVRQSLGGAYSLDDLVGENDENDVQSAKAETSARKGKRWKYGDMDVVDLTLD